MTALVSSGQFAQNMNNTHGAVQASNAQLRQRFGGKSALALNPEDKCVRPQLAAVTASAAYSANTICATSLAGLDQDCAQSRSGHWANSSTASGRLRELTAISHKGLAVAVGVRLESQHHHE